jgi:putative component of toxin-antitoxin plasmid stabilization module
MRIRHRDEREYEKWSNGIDDREIAKIGRRLEMLRLFGIDIGMPTVRRIDGEVSEVRSGKYRLYFTVVDAEAVCIAYGEKDTQQRDIERARQRAREYRT